MVDYRFHFSEPTNGYFNIKGINVDTGTEIAAIGINHATGAGTGCRISLGDNAANWHEVDPIDATVLIKRAGANAPDNIIKFTDAGTTIKLTKQGDVEFNGTTYQAVHLLPNAEDGDYGSNGGAGHLVLGSAASPLLVAHSQGLRMGTWGLTTYSDQRIKTNIANADINTCLSNINNLSLKTYDYIDTEKMGNQTVHGFLAQEVKNVIPNAVMEMIGTLPSGETVNDFHHLRKMRIFTQLVGAVQKLSQKVDDLTQRIEVLES